MYIGRERLHPPSDISDLSGNFRCINFYIAVKVRDDRLVFGGEKFGRSHEDDAVEIYFDGDLAPRNTRRASWITTPTMPRYAFP